MKPWHVPLPGPRVPYWLQPRDREIEGQHVALMRKVEKEAKHEVQPSGVSPRRD